jgi:glycosyltransferase involved in cell wall biosynthesis
MGKRQTGVTVIIPTYNAERWIDKLLKTVIPWSNEVIVCDSYSTDKTPEIAISNNIVFVQHEYVNSATQKNWIIPQARQPWILIIDSDELPEPGLLNEIDTFLMNAPEDVDMAYIPRMNMLWGELPRKGMNYPDYQSRLFRRDKGRYQDKEVHAQVEVPGKVVYLKNALVHDDFKSISTWWLRNDRYFGYELKELLKNKKKWTYSMQYLKPLYVFVKLYFGKKLFLLGFRGFFLAAQWCVYYFFVGARLYEYEYLNKQKTR